MKTTRVVAFTFALLVMLPIAAHAQDDGPSNPMMASFKGLHDITETNIMKTAEMLSDELYAYQPTDDVRTAGEILAHVANAQLLFCSAAAGKDSPAEGNYEETGTTKADIIAALKTGFAYCQEVYAKMSDADAAQMRQFFGNEMAASAILAFNSAHNYEHYGNLVTYMRINGITPPSSAQQ